MLRITYRELKKKLPDLRMRLVKSIPPAHLWINVENGTTIVIPDEGDHPLSGDAIAKICNAVGCTPQQLDD